MGFPMTKAKALLPGLLYAAISMGMILTSSPLAADEIADLKRQIEMLAQKIEALEQQRQQQAQAKPVETVNVRDVVSRGDIRNSFKIPGTETSMRISGRVETSMIYDVGARPTSRGGDIASARAAILEGTPEYDNRGDTRFTARNSRFGIATSTPTRFGPMRTFIEGDFNGPPNDKGSRAGTSRTAFGIRHAYGELGNVLFGHYWSSYMDRAAFPSKVDGTGPVGRTFVRQGQLRYTHDLGEGQELVFAMENPRADFDGADDENLHDGYPDLISYYQIEQERWHLKFSGLLRRVGVKQTDPLADPFPADDETFAWGLNQSGSFRMPWNDDRFTWYLNAGNGLGRYIDGGNDQGATVTSDGKLDNQFAYGGFLSYKHYWTETLESNIDFGISFFDLNPEEVGDANKRLYSSHMNLIWNPMDKLRFGVEYVWGHRVVHDGRTGDIDRFQLTSWIYF